MHSPLVVLSLLWKSAALAQTDEPSSSVIEREYFTVLESPQDNCVSACDNIEGVCNPQRITQLALDIGQCRDAIISFVEWTNAGLTGELSAQHVVPVTSDVCYVRMCTSIIICDGRGRVCVLNRGVVVCMLNMFVVFSRAICLVSQWKRQEHQRNR